MTFSIMSTIIKIRFRMKRKEASGNEMDDGGEEVAMVWSLRIVEWRREKGVVEEKRDDFFRG